MKKLRMGKPSGLRGLGALGPGLLVAATGVGAGDLATASLVGADLGMVVLWAAVCGAFFKYVLSEGLTRWQLATGTTLLEGCSTHFGRPFRLVFAVYLILWSYFVGAALISACGVATHALIPLFHDAATGKTVWGILNSAAGLVLVWAGGYRLFRGVMRVCIAIMFVSVCVAAVQLVEDWGDVAAGLLVPRIPLDAPDGLRNTIALMGGVGGTLTIIAYGYWIREERRESVAALRACRVDLGIGYLFTALFGIAMVIIGNRIHVEGQGARLIVVLGEALEEPLGTSGKWLFLAGAYGAVFSSLLGVWQSVPLIFADLWSMHHGGDRLESLDRTQAYRGYLVALATVPLVGLWFSFREVQLYYSWFGACFMPGLAAALLLLNNRRSRIGNLAANGAGTNVLLAAILAFFVIAAWFGVE